MLKFLLLSAAAAAPALRGAGRTLKQYDGDVPAAFEGSEALRALVEEEAGRKLGETFQLVPEEEERAIEANEALARAKALADAQAQLAAAQKMMEEAQALAAANAAPVAAAVAAPAAEEAEVAQGATETVAEAAPSVAEGVAALVRPAEEVDAFVKGGQFSVFKAKVLELARARAPAAKPPPRAGCGCQLRLEILPKSGSGEFKFKVLSLMTASKPGQLKFGHQAGFNVRPEEPRTEKTEQWLTDSTNRVRERERKGELPPWAKTEAKAAG